MMETYGISLEIIELEIKATLGFLEKYHNDRYSTAIVEGHEIAKNLDIDSTFAETGIERKNNCLVMRTKMKVIIILRR